LDRFAANLFTVPELPEFLGPASAICFLRQIPMTELRVLSGKNAAICDALFPSSANFLTFSNSSDDQ
jgi:hypothetical protein